MRKTVLSISGVLVLGCSCGALAAGQDVTVGVEDLAYAPYYSNEGGQYRSFAREVLDLFGQRRGYQMHYLILPVPRLWEEFFAQNKLDLKFPDHPKWNAERKKGVNISYSKAVVDYTDGVLVLAKNQGKALATLGSVRGFSPWEYLADIGAGKLKLSENNNLASLLQMGVSGRVDGVYANVVVADYTLREQMKQPGALVFDASLPHTRSAYLLSSNRRPELIKEFDDFLSKEKSAIDALKQKYRVN